MQTRGKRVNGQSTAEYAILIAIVVAAMVGMQTYIKRGLQAKYRDASDTLTQSVTVGDVTLPQLHQYEPYYASSTFHTHQNQQGTETVSDGGGVTHTGVTETTTRDTGIQEQRTTLDQDDAWR